jgi:hypothetical protein
MLPLRARGEESLRAAKNEILKKRVKVYCLLKIVVQLELITDYE